MPHTITTIFQDLGMTFDPRAVHIGNQAITGRGPQLSIECPADGRELAAFPQAAAEQVGPIVESSLVAHRQWRTIPAPHRGELVRRLGNSLRQHREALAKLVTAEAGKIMQESLGEVQEMIDICDFAVGLSRQLYGKTMPSERPLHRLTEQWHPLGPVGIITAFNFPVAVWAWNAALALVCGNSLIWKPSEKTPLTALACHAIFQKTANGLDGVPENLSTVIVGGSDVGQALAASTDVPLISATGSVRMGKAVAQTVATRLGRSLLELGGNNGMIVTPTADLDLTVRSIVFAAVGTCGQRCTSLRRLFVHQSLADALVERLKTIYAKLPIGDPATPGTLIGPLIDVAAVAAMDRALQQAKEQGGTVYGGGATMGGKGNKETLKGHYVHPAIVEIGPEAAIVKDETFAPILYVLRYQTLEQAIAWHNDVPQGLASAIMTSDVREAELFCSAAGSDCGIVNVNIGTSGAEIGGAFGGEKETGGGRESGSDSWKAYMRRATNTVNYSDALPLAQGIQFEVT